MHRRLTKTITVDRQRPLTLLGTNVYNLCYQCNMVDGIFKQTGKQRLPVCKMNVSVLKKLGFGVKYHVHKDC